MAMGKNWDLTDLRFYKGRSTFMKASCYEKLRRMAEFYSKLSLFSSQVEFIEFIHPQVITDCLTLVYI